MKEEVFKLTGMQYYADNLKSLASKNPDYSLNKSEILESYSEGDTIWQYEFLTQNYTEKLYEIIPEPENEYDPNAVAVYLQGKKIGYVKKGKCSRIKNLLKSKDYRGSNLDVGGGKYKRVKYDYDTGREYVETGEYDNYFASLTIYLNEEPKQEEVKKEDKKPEPIKTEPIKQESIKPEIKEDTKKGGFFSKLFGKK